MHPSSTGARAAFLLVAWLSPDALGSAPAPSPSSPATLATPTQPTALVAEHRSGQTFVTWTQSVDPTVERYRVYRHDQAIDATNIGDAELLSDQWPDSSLFSADRWFSTLTQSWQQRHFTRYVIENNGSELAATTELLVWTLAEEDFGGGTSGPGYYAVTSVDDLGAENLLDFGPDNSIGPVGEVVNTPEPVRGVVLQDGKCEIYIRYLDLRDFNPTLFAPNVYNTYYGLDSGDPTVANARQYAVTYALFPPYEGSCSDGITEFPLMVEMHGQSGLASRPWTFDPDPGWCNAYRIYPLDPGNTWWFGNARDHDFRSGLAVPSTDVIENYTERWLLEMVDSMLTHPTYGSEIDPDRVYAIGHSMGASGALALAMRYPNVFAGAHASQPMTDYETSGSGGGTSWVADVAFKWGPAAEDLPILLDGPNGYADHLKVHDGTSVWDWQNHQLQLVARRGADFAPFGIDHGILDTIIEWSTQGQPAYAPLDQSASCWAGEVTNTMHTNSQLSTLPGALQEDVGGWPFHDWQVVRDESVPGLSETTGPPLPPTAIGTFNEAVDWSASWKDWDGPPLDDVDSWQISLRSTEGVPLSTRVTPRRLQNFEVLPGFAYRWANVDVLTDLEVASGTFAADADGLLTTPSVTVSTDGNRILVEKSLTAVETEISLTTGGTQVLRMACGADMAGKLAWVLGSVSGTSPGIPVGGIEIPLVEDGYFDLTLAHPNSALLAPSLASLAGDGRSTCTLTLPTGMNPSLAGTTVHHAFVVLDLPGDGSALFTSNPVAVDLIP